MSKIKWFVVVKGHSRLLEILPFDRAYEFLLTFHINCHIMHRFGDIVRYWSKIAKSPI